jgi:oxygen-independent coproporphyrinogen-3 oxidase
LKNEFITALLKEISLRKYFLQNYTIETIYFGGGTPSILEAAEVQLIMEEIHRNFHTEAVEITLEANPDDISTEKIRAWKNAGINRLSIGIQSFEDESLSKLNRAHTARQAVDSIRMARENGIENLTIDLIYGIPGLTDHQWEKNILTAIDAGVQHLSCYALTVEPRTALEYMIRKKTLQDVDQDQQARQFLMLMDIAAAKGFEHYEISNFALPGFRSRHNSSYWKGKPYLGFGPGAHSYDLHSRYWNIANNALYIQSVNAEDLPLEKETLNISQQFNEYVMTALRTIEGINKQVLEEKFGKERMENVHRILQKFIEEEEVFYNGNAYTLTNKGKLFADGIAMELFEV